MDINIVIKELREEKRKLIQMRREIKRIRRLLNLEATIDEKIIRIQQTIDSLNN